MAIEIRQNLSQEMRLTQELVMTPQLQMAIKLLQLNRLELVDRVREEMEQNPLLEDESEAEQPEKAEGSDLPQLTPEPPRQEPADGAQQQMDVGGVDWEQYLNQYDNPPPSDRPLEIPEERASLENIISTTTTLQDHLMWQLRLSNLDAGEQAIGELVVGNVDEKGYLSSTVEEIAEMSGATPEAVLTVLETIWQFDPTGVASRNLTECLVRQARELGAPDFVFGVITHDLKLLETKNYKKIAKDLGLTFEEVVEAARIIAGLNPNPGREYEETRVDYVVPDVYVSKADGRWVVRLNDDGVPRLRVSPYYRSLLTDETDVGKAAKSYIQERMQAALWLIKSINQRQQTLMKVSESIVKFQEEFLDHGPTRLRPLILKDVAEDIGMHESTVSRVTTGKYMHTPKGTFELKYFFSSAIQMKNGEDLASRSVKERMKEIIGREDQQNPLSDIQIAEILTREFSMKIARRTVSKYREAMGILPSSSRRSYF